MDQHRAALFEVQELRPSTGAMEELGLELVEAKSGLERLEEEAWERGEAIEDLTELLSEVREGWG